MMGHLPFNILEGFDLKTAVVTTVLLPLLSYLFLIIRKSLKEWGRYAVEGIIYYFGRFLRKSLAGKLTLKRYCRLRLAEENQYLYVPGRTEIKLPIDKVFVNLSIDCPGDEKCNFDHSDILSVSNRIRIVGDPGSGKSSLVKRLFRDACNYAIAKPSRALLPIMLELKDLKPPDNKKASSGKWLLDTIRSDTTSSNVFRMNDCFDSYVNGNGLLVLLDGLDEVSTSNYKRVHEAIISLGNILAKNSEHTVIVITMRTQFHQHVKDDFILFGKVAFIRPFSPSDIYEFLTKWPFEKDRDKLITKIYSDLTDIPTLRDMCTNPLILSMYVSEDMFSGNLGAPESRTEFYKQVTDELVIKRRIRQTGLSTAHSKLKEQRQHILGQLAYRHLVDTRQPTNLLQWNTAIRVVRESFRCNKTDAESILFELAKDTGLLHHEREGETFRFIHLTFCEFYAALEAVEGLENGWATLIETFRRFQTKGPHARSRLIEVIPFACGLLHRVKKAKAMEDILKLNAPDLLARCFLETKAYDHPCWTGFINAQKDALLQEPEKGWDDQWLRDLHLFNVVVRDAIQCSRHVPSIEYPVDLEKFFGVLVEQQRESLSKLLFAYAAQDGAAVFRLAEIANLDLARTFPRLIIENCDQAPFFALAKDRALSSMRDFELWAPLILEAALGSRIVAKWLYDTDTSHMLQPQVDGLPRHKRWTFDRRTSLYAQVLSLVVNADSNCIDHTPLINTLSKVKPLSKYWFIYTQLIAFAMLVCSSLIIKLTLPFVFFLPSVCLGEYTLVRVIATKKMYQRLLFVEDTFSKVDPIYVISKILPLPRTAAFGRSGLLKYFIARSLRDTFTEMETLRRKITV